MKIKTLWIFYIFMDFLYHLIQKETRIQFHEEIIRLIIKNPLMKFIPLTLTATLLLSSGLAYAQAPVVEADPELDAILSLDISELTITSVAKREQKLSRAAAAVYVITQEDIRRTGVSSVPEALRMVPGLEVARAGSHQWAITARGFNDTTANKLLVLVDGRSVYTHIYSGTYWDDQMIPLIDIERIEVIRGPGGSLWGANAVNGIINVITKDASNTVGNQVIAGVGNEEQFVEGRHGVKVDDNTFYRTYARLGQMDDSQLVAGGDTVDNWNRVQAGFRLDKKPSERDSYTVSAHAYSGKQDSQTSAASPTAPFTVSTLGDDDSYGGNVLGRWSRQLNENESVELFASADYYTRNEIYFEQRVANFNLEAQHNIALNDRNNFVWGVGALANVNNLTGTYAVSVGEENMTHEVFSAFLQNEYAIVPDKWYLTLGSKFEYNDYTGFEVQPNARLAWHATDNQTVWASVSRAVQTPSVLYDDVRLVLQTIPGAPPSALSVFGSHNFESQEVVAYELGHRIQYNKDLSLDTTVFYNQYDKQATYAASGAPILDPTGVLIVPYLLANEGSGNGYGAEVAANWNVTSDWRLAASYTYLETYLDVPPTAAASLEATEENVPQQQFSARSYWNITDKLQWDNMFYYVDSTRLADAYLRYDMRLGWEFAPGYDMSVIGQNLLDEAHPEYSTTREIEQSFIVRVTAKF